MPAKLISTVDTLVIIPQAGELEPLVRELTRRGHAIHTSTVGRLECIIAPELRMLFAVGGHGKVQFAVQTQRLIEQLLEPGIVLCAGAAGGLIAELHRGDVVVGTYTVEHDYRLRFSSQPLPCHQAHQPAVERFRHLARDLRARFTIHFGPIASGDEDIVDRDRARQLHRETGAVCVAWEGAGGVRTAAFNRLPFVEVRAITDSAGNNAAEEFHDNLEMAMQNLAEVLSRWSRTEGAA